MSAFEIFCIVSKKLNADALAHQQFIKIAPVPSLYTTPILTPSTH